MSEKPAATLEVPPDLEQLVAEADTGGRKPTGLAAQILLCVAVFWSLFQLWYASPLPFVFGIGVLNDTEARAIHLGLALLIFAGLIWTGLEAWFGRETSRSPVGWSRGAAILLGAVFLQCLLGGLVAGAKAGFVYTDWPMMNGEVLAPVEWGMGALAFLHDQALVQFNHRITAYGLLVGGTVYALQAWRWRLAEGLGASAFVVAAALWLQATLGVVTLIHAVPLWLGALHQAGAALVLAAATVNLWLVRRSQPRLFMSGPRSRVL